MPVSDNPTILTSENSAEFYAKALDITSEVVIEKPTEKPAEVVETAGDVVIETPVEETAEQKETREKEAKKHELNERMSKMTQDRKDAIARAEAAERRAAELEAKLAPPAIVESPGKPDPSKFTDAFEYAEALADWKVNDALAKRDADAVAAKDAERRNKVTETWNKQADTLRTEIPTFDTDLETGEGRDVNLHNAVVEAMIESDNGRRIQHYLVTNKAEAERIAALSIPSAIREIGKLDAKFTKAPEPNLNTTKPETIAREISKAPPPPIPLKAANAPVQTKVDANGNWTGTYAEFKAADAAGKL